MKLLVALPCLNEQDTLGAVLDSIPSIELASTIDVLVVDDGSDDKTSEVARAHGAHVIRHRRNYGVGVAFQTAAGYAITHGYDAMVHIDADGQFDPKHIPQLLEPLVNGTADMVTASRFANRSMVPEMPFVKRVGNWMMAYLISKLAGERFHDVSCGFRAYSREALLNLNLHGKFTYTQETFLDLCYKRLRIVEVPVSVRYFPERRSRVAGSILRYAINTTLIIFRCYRDYYPLRFFVSIGGVILFLALCLAVFFFGHYVATGRFTGHLWAGFLSGSLALIGGLFVVVGIIADMLDRIRVNQERIISLLKKR